MNYLQFLNKAIGWCGRFYYDRNHVNWLVTLYFNLRQLPLKCALKLPIHIYFNTRLTDLSGKIVINTDIHNGMVKIGKQWTRSQGNTYFQNRGIWIINGTMTLCKGTRLQIMPGAIFETGNNVNVRECCYISVNKKVVLGNNSEFAYSCQIIDSDFHYTINTATRQCHYIKSDILIGDDNWIGSYTTIKKGTKTPNKCIIASSYSILCKDYTKDIPENSIIGGIPARLIATGRRRVFNLKSQSLLSTYFHNTSNQIFVLDENQDIDEFC